MRAKIGRFTMPALAPNNPKSRPFKQCSLQFPLGARHTRWRWQVNVHAQVGPPARQSFAALCAACGSCLAHRVLNRPNDCLTYRQMDPQTLVQAPAPSAPKMSPAFLPCKSPPNGCRKNRASAAYRILCRHGAHAGRSCSADLGQLPWAASYFATWHAPLP